MGRLQQRGRRSGQRHRPVDDPGVRGRGQYVGNMVGDNRAERTGRYADRHGYPDANSDANANSHAEAEAHTEAEAVSETEANPDRNADLLLERRIAPVGEYVDVDSN